MLHIHLHIRNTFVTLNKSNKDGEVGAKMVYGRIDIKEQPSGVVCADASLFALSGELCLS